LNYDIDKPFVSRLELEASHPTSRRALARERGVLKVKLANSDHRISSIHLLKTSSTPALREKTLMLQTVIHVAFLVSALAIAFTERLATPQHTKHRGGVTLRAPREATKKKPQEVELLRHQPVA